MVIVRTVNTNKAQECEMMYSATVYSNMLDTNRSVTGLDSVTSAPYSKLRSKKVTILQLSCETGSPFLYHIRGSLTLKL